MTLEKRLSEALHSADRFHASPDLFARVERSVAEDRAHRRRFARNVALAVLAMGLIAAFLGAVAKTNASGRLDLLRGALQVVETFVMITLIVVVGPSIRRFGLNYIADVFHASPGTGVRVLKLLDTAYYLVFSGLLLTSATFTRLELRVSLADGLEHSFDRIGRLTLVMGLLHALTLALLPIVGFVFSSIVWRARRAELGAEAPPISDGARQSERVIRIGLIGLGIAVGLFMLLFVFTGILGAVGA